MVHGRADIRGYSSHGKKHGPRWGGYGISMTVHQNRSGVVSLQLVWSMLPAQVRYSLTLDMLQGVRGLQHVTSHRWRITALGHVGAIS
jgi:hypothetical protein